MSNNGNSRGTVVITGASAGIGRAAVRKFAKEGYRVGLIARGEDGLEAALREVESHGVKGYAIQCDVSDPEGVEIAAEQVEQELGPIDIWVNNAMVSVFSTVKEMQPREYQRVMEVCYLGYVHGTLVALKRMSVRNQGVILQVGSALAYRSIPLQSAYCAAKHAIVGFTDSLRCELLAEGSQVHVTIVHMPAVNTPQFAWVKSRLPKQAQPVPPIFQPEVAADAIYTAAHSDRRELWVGRSTVASIIGQRLIPGLLDHYLARTGFDAQQTDKPRALDRGDNLWSPMDRKGGGDFGAHGHFDAQAASWSPLLAASKTLGRRGAAIAGFCGAALAIWASSRSRR